MPKIAINGFELYYEDGGSGAPVVFIHGGFASLDTTLHDLPPYAWTWEQDFAGQFHFIWYDRRGCYRSSCPDAGYELANQARDLELLLDYLGISSTNLIGSSAGGPIAILFAATKPSRARSLVLAGTGLDLFPHGDLASDIIRQQIDLLEREGAAAAFDQRPEGVEVSFGVLWEREEMEVRGELNEYLERQRVWVHKAGQLPKAQRIRHYAAELKNIKAYMGVDVRAYAQQLASPTLVLHGSDDRMVPLDLAKELAQVIPSAQLHIVPGGSHGLVFRDAKARRTIIEFIQRVETGGA
ncbi:alpha/beta hydrolase [Candidatus Poribacteria bacterium]|nr:alpha/beta hydrolase [Candidatus Poribacteria bacterium]